MILYLDTSALVKLYADEAGSEMVRRAVVRAQLVATSFVTYAETRSALARKRREGGISAAGLKRLKREFERDWARLQRLPIDEATVRKAGELAEEHALRAFDAIHLATADSLQVALRAAVTFACFDSLLSDAAKLRGLDPLV
ncbi:MAG: type II toxin-antitoxin system VapC family toxin [Candidatus Binataceae bacterium]